MTTRRAALLAALVAALAVGCGNERAGGDERPVEPDGLGQALAPDEDRKVGEGEQGEQAADADHALEGDADDVHRRPVVGGDSTSAAIAAASVIAKVTRDRFMRRMEARYPGWEFAAHVGYSTPEHRAAIERLGVSPLHRLSFQSMAYQQLAL